MHNYKNWLENSEKDSDVSIICENIALSFFFQRILWLNMA